MALDKLGLYNEALRLLGERRLADITENREPRHLLDSAYDFGAVEHCLELIKPVFARKTVLLNTPSVSANHDLDSVHNLPSDWVAMVGIYSDSKLDQEITRFINENRTLACEYDTVYARYVSDDNKEVYSAWSPSFAKVVAHYLAKEIAVRLAPQKLAEQTQLFKSEVENALGIENAKEPMNRSNASTTTLTESLRAIYNDALMIIGQTKITSLTDDSHRRSVLDTVFDTGVVEMLLEDIGWHWAIKSVCIEYDPSVEPLWGYAYAFDKPTDLHRFDGIWYDEFHRSPIKHYTDDQSHFFCDTDIIYISYVSKDFITTPESWSPAFRKLVAGRMAQESVLALNPEAFNRAEAEFERRYSRAKAVDAQQSPPRILTSGNWSRARGATGNGRGRP